MTGILLYPFVIITRFIIPIYIVKASAFIRLSPKETLRDRNEHFSKFRFYVWGYLSWGYLSRTYLQGHRKEFVNGGSF